MKKSQKRLQIMRLTPVSTPTLRSTSMELPKLLVRPLTGYQRGRGTTEGQGEEHTISPFTIAEEPLHALSWKYDPYPGWSRVTSIMDSGA